MKTVLTKLNNIQQELKAPKSQFNKFGNYKYRNAEDILESVKPLLKSNGCVITITDDIVNIGNRFYVKAEAKLTDVESGEIYSTTAFAREEETKKGMDGSQITGASSSYARKYALNGLFAIDDTKDSDSTNVNGNGKDEKVLNKIRNAKSQKELGDIYSSLTEEEQPLYLTELGNKKQELKK